MKNIFLLMWVFIYCLITSCKKDSDPISITPQPPIDSFYLHPPPVYDSLPFPLKIGNWWKYQRFDSVGSYSNISTWKARTSNSIELITIVGKLPFVFNIYSGNKNRYDTVPSFIYETKNLTTGIIDTAYLLYYNAAFMSVSKKPYNSTLPFRIKVPIVEGQVSSSMDSYNNISNSAISVLNITYNGCLFTERSSSSIPTPDGFSNHFITYLKPGIGFVDWKYDETISSHYLDVTKNYYYRKLMDYHLE